MGNFTQQGGDQEMSDRCRTLRGPRHFQQAVSHVYAVFEELGAAAERRGFCCMHNVNLDVSLFFAS